MQSHTACELPLIYFQLSISSRSSDNFSNVTNRANKQEIKHFVYSEPWCYINNLKNLFKKIIYLLHNPTAVSLPSSLQVHPPPTSSLTPPPPFDLLCCLSTLRDKNQSTKLEISKSKSWTLIESPFLCTILRWVEIELCYRVEVYRYHRIRNMISLCWY